MAKKSKQGKELLDSQSGRVAADLNFSRRSSVNFKTEVGLIREVFPDRSKDDVTLVLQSCDHNVEAAIACFANGEADNVLRQWNVQGKKSNAKNGNSSKKKRNKKKQGKGSTAETNGADCTSQLDDNVTEAKPSANKDLEIVTEDTCTQSAPVDSIKCSPGLSSLSLLHPPSPSDSEVSLPSLSADHASVHPTQCLELSGKQLSAGSAPPVKAILLGPDALKKTVKDLQRSSVSLARFQLLLEEECEKSFKVITKTFEELRQCVADREAQLISEMEEFKKQAVELLEQRQENAAALKLKSDRVGGMQETEVTQLRSEIKNFVTERKIDEELARTTRFVGDKEKLLSTIKSFGEVVPIKTCYSPVTLNPPALPTKKPENYHPKKTSPEAAVLKAANPSTATTELTVPMVRKFSSHEELQEAAEMHAKLQAALKKQGLSKSEGKQFGGQKQAKPETKTERPISASQKPAPREPPPQRPQTSWSPNDEHRKDQRLRQKQADIGHVDQSARDSRRPNQRRPPMGEPGSDLANVKRERPQSSSEKAEDENSGKGVVRGPSQQPRLDTVKMQQPREKQECGNEGSRNRRVRRRGRGSYEDKLTKNKNTPAKETPENNENSLEQKPDNSLNAGNGKEGSVVMDDGETTGKKHPSSTEDCAHEGSKENGAIPSPAKEPSSVENGMNSMNGKAIASESSNGVKNPEKEKSQPSEGLPQREDRSFGRRGSRRDKKDGPPRRRAAHGDQHVTATAENGTVNHHGDKERLEKNVVENSKESPANGVSPKANKTDGHGHQDHENPLEVDLVKADPPHVNGYIPVKEIKGSYTIDR